MLCGECKAGHVDEVVAAVDRHRPRPAQDAASVAGCAPAVTTAVAVASRSLYRPPPRNVDALERAIADYAGVEADQVVVANGVTQVLDWIFHEQARCLPERGSVLAGEPTFELYRELAARHRMSYRTVPWDGPMGGHRLTDFAAVMAEGIDAVAVVDSPHTVSGVPTSLADVLTGLVPSLRPRARLVVDNVFAEFMARPMRLTANMIEGYDGLVVCRSLSKAHGLLGARIGYAITSAGYAARLRCHRLPYAINSLSLGVAHAALRDTDTLARNVAASRQAMAALTSCLERAGLRYAPSDANFLLIDLGDRRDQILDVLRRRGLRFRDGGRWQLPTTIQVHVIDAPSVAALISAFTEV